MSLLNKVNPNYYAYDFYSGANVSIYVGDLLVTSALGIEFNLVQNKRPFWGYASQLWDGVAKGTVQCAGNLILNFQKHQFLPILINESLGHNSDIEFTDLEHNENYFGLRTASKTTDKFFIDNGVDTAFNQRTGGLPGWMSEADRKKLMQQYWGGMNHSIKNTKALMKQIPSLYSARRPDDHLNPFDIIITYGDVFGNDLREAPQTKNVNPSLGLSTIHRLYSVELTGLGQTIQADGQPVLEQYPFICREII